MSRAGMPAALAAMLAFAAVPARAEVEFTGKNYPDPFVEAGSAGPGDDEIREAKATQSALQSLSVEGIVVSPGGNLAIVKGKVIRAGDSIQGFRVQSIQPDGVVLAVNTGGERQLYKLTHKGKAKP